MQSNAELIDHLVASGVLHTPTIIEAFHAIDRKDFVPAAYRHFAYDDNPLPIGYEATISQPTTVAFMLELLHPQKGQKILDIGSGSGWTTALLASIVGDAGSVIGLDIIPALVEHGQKNLDKYNLNTHVLQAPAGYGLPSAAPFDRILVSAAAQELPHELIDQLTRGGILVLPVRQAVVRVRRTGKTDHEEERYPCFLFVPLRSTNVKRAHGEPPA